MSFFIKVEQRNWRIITIYNNWNSQTNTICCKTVCCWKAAVAWNTQIQLQAVNCQQTFDAYVLSCLFALLKAFILRQRQNPGCSQLRESWSESLNTSLIYSFNNPPVSSNSKQVKQRRCYKPVMMATAKGQRSTALWWGKKICRKYFFETWCSSKQTSEETPDLPSYRR